MPFVEMAILIYVIFIMKLFLVKSYSLLINY